MNFAWNGMEEKCCQITIYQPKDTLNVVLPSRGQHSSMTAYSQAYSFSYPVHSRHLYWERLLLINIPLHSNHHVIPWLLNALFGLRSVSWCLFHERPLCDTELKKHQDNTSNNTQILPMHLMWLPGLNRSNVVWLHSPVWSGVVQFILLWPCYFSFQELIINTIFFGAPCTLKQESLINRAWMHLLVEVQDQVVVEMKV